MTTYSVRCKNSTCRQRRTTSVHPDEAKKIFRCPTCKQLRGWRIEHSGPERRKMCNCNSVVNDKGRTYPHRHGQHPYCDHHPLGFLNQAARQGITDPGDLTDAVLEGGGRELKQGEECPF